MIFFFFLFFSELINIDELIGAVRKLQNIPDEFKLQQISEVLSKIDDDHDGSIRLDTVLKVRFITVSYLKLLLITNVLC